MPGPKTGDTERVRAYISRIDGPFSGKVVLSELSIPSTKFYYVMLEMLKRGEVERVSRGWYRYCPVQVNKRPAPLRSKLLRAMHVKIRFSVREIAQLADTTPACTRYLVIHLRKAGEIEAIGRQRTPHGRWETVFRVRDKDGFFFKHIRGEVK